MEGRVEVVERVTVSMGGWVGQEGKVRIMLWVSILYDLSRKLMKMMTERAAFFCSEISQTFCSQKRYLGVYPH